jgi:predicted RNA methylase
MVRSAGEYGKGYHQWQQPVPPFRYWLETLTRPGELVADPFAGAASIGVALKQIGARKYLATEVDRDTAAVARGRLDDVEEGSA